MKKKELLRRWRVVWCFEQEHGRTNGVDFVNAVDQYEAALAVAKAHPRCVITYTAPDTKDPRP